METEIKNLVIDETYSGLIDAGWCFKLQGNLEVTGSLTVNLKRWLIVSGHIEAGGGIKAGWGIKAGEGIKAGWGIEAGEGIKAGWGIEAGWGIKAGEGIKAGGGIEAGGGIKAGLTITCKLTLKAVYQIFAGIVTWRKATDADKVITCKRLESGTVAYGILVETGKDAK